MTEHNQSQYYIMIYGKMLEALPLKQGQDKDSFYYHYYLIFLKKISQNN